MFIKPAFFFDKARLTIVVKVKASINYPCSHAVSIASVVVLECIIHYSLRDSVLGYRWCLSERLTYASKSQVVHKTKVCNKS
jgi:hypothetical protein